MCDVVIACPTNTKDRIFIFAKNSDRAPNEAQIIEFSEGSEGKGGKFKTEKIKMTYTELEISEISTLKGKERVNAIFISRPWWIWGAEMGANEHGVVVGNTAVFTKKVRKEPGILGMDIVRLVLMFASSAKEGTEIIAEIIEKFGQGGSGSFEHKFFYDNSFLIADKEEAYVIETAGKEWTMKKVQNYSISNILTLENNWDKCSVGVEKMKTRKRKNSFGFSREFSDKLFTFLAHGKERCSFTRAVLGKNGIDIYYMIKAMSSTGFENGRFIHKPPYKSSTQDVCMHYRGFFCPAQTASSQISELYEDVQVHWITGTSLPCMSIFKPVYFIAGSHKLNRSAANTENKYNPKSYWWRAERLHRKIQLAYDEIGDEFSEEKDKIQDEIIETEREVRSKYKSEDELLKITLWAFELEEKFISKWEEKIEKIKVGSIRKRKLLYRIIWALINRKAGII